MPAFLDDARAELRAARCATMEALDAARERRCSVIRYEPDILGRGLDVIFCGLNPAASAARAGHNFSSRSNRFWMVLHLAGFMDIRLQPEDEHRLLEYGCGITTVVGRPTKRADEVLPEEFLKARLRFETRIRLYAPRSIAFLGKRALSVMIGQPDAEWGQHAMGFAGTMAWVLPNPSGLNRSFSVDALVASYSEFRTALLGNSAKRMPRSISSLTRSIVRSRTSTGGALSSGTPR